MSQLSELQQEETVINYKEKGMQHPQRSLFFQCQVEFSACRDSQLFYRKTWQVVWKQCCCELWDDDNCCEW